MLLYFEFPYFLSIYLSIFFYLCIAIGIERTVWPIGIRFGMHTCGGCRMVAT